MDPINTLLISSAIGGAAGGFVKEISSNGVKWLVELVTAQSPQMQQIAKKNVENFVERLAQRVERLEKDISPEKSELFQNALNHPSSALLIKGALIDAAITEDEDKHDLLAELISQRLTAGADDMIALAGAAACQVISSLGSRQIKILAVLATAKSIRPLTPIEVSSKEQALHQVNKWWSQNLNPFVLDPTFEKATSLDFEHLAAMGCSRISIGSVELVPLLQKGIVKDPHAVTSSDFESYKWFQILNRQWEGLAHSTATSTGQLIGILHRDTKLKTMTKIDW